MTRPILVVTLGFITGIITGLYINIAPFILLIFMLVIIIIKAKNINSNNNYIRILKLYVKNNIILTFVTSALISSIYFIYCDKEFQKVYNTFNASEIIATVISNKKETEYKNTYIVQVERNKQVKLLLQVSKKNSIILNYGYKIKVKGNYKVPEQSRNYRGFNYKEYLKTQKIYGIFNAETIEILSNNNVNKIEMFSFNLKQKIITNINKILPENTKELFLGILIGYDDKLDESIKENFKKSSLTHLLAVSGAHIAYIIVGLNFLFSKLKFLKSITSTLEIVILILFMYITEFSASVVRASIMGIVLLLSLVFHRKNDITTSISISILLILIENPYKILDIGLILSYFATIGIICFSKLRKKSNKDLNIKEKIIGYTKEVMLITAYANILVIPIMAYNFNTISFTFIISNLIAGILIGPITIGGFILIIISLLNLKLAYIISIPYNILLELLVLSTKFTSLIPLSEVLVTTPNIIIIIIYYTFIFIYILYKLLKKKYSKRYLIKKISEYIQKILKFLKTNIVLILTVSIILIIIIFLISKLIPKQFKIYFIDVGQGDSTLLITPTNKKILIDSGGSEDGSFDVGKNTLVPYLLDRKIMLIDYICISHFDSDHCQGFIYLLKNIKVKNIILSKQYKTTKNFEDIIKIAKEKKINILKVEAGNVLQIDKFIKINILSPGKELADDINENSIVMKIEYIKFSCLFTGDISKDVEQNLVKKYGKYLESDILKVAHHGSKTSSDEVFIKTVNPKISLIGVGKNNKFGHPNEEVLKVLESVNSKIYRTDLYGEIIFKINKKREDKSI